MLKKSKLQKLIITGLSINKIAKKLGIGRSSVRYWLNKYNLKTRIGKSPSIWTENQLIRALKESVTISDVLKKVGLKIRPGNYTTIRRFVKKHNIDLSHTILICLI